MLEVLRCRSTLLLCNNLGLRILSTRSAKIVGQEARRDPSNMTTASSEGSLFLPQRLSNLTQRLDTSLANSFTQCCPTDYSLALSSPLRAQHVPTRALRGCFGVFVLLLSTSDPHSDLPVAHRQAHSASSARPSNARRGASSSTQGTCRVRSRLSEQHRSSS